jgi:hypothetical protein
MNAENYPVSQLCVNTLLGTKITLITNGISPLLMSYIYMELLVKPEILRSYIYMDLRLATLKVVYFYFLQNVSTLNERRKLSCVTVVCKQFASYQGYPNYTRDLIWYAEG